MVANMKRIDMYITEREMVKLNTISDETGINRSELIRRAIDEYIDKTKLSKEAA